MRRALTAGILLAWIALGASGCATSVEVEFDAVEDFSGYRTWSWLPPGWPTPRDRVGRDLHHQVRAAIERGLEARGYALAQPAEADFFVTYHLTLERQLVEAIETPAMQTLSTHHREGGYEVTASRRTLQLYEEGTLVLDVADGQDRQLVWRGVGTRRVRESFGIRADDVVSALLDRFPPRGRSAF